MIKLNCNQTILLLDIKRGYMSTRHPNGCLKANLQVLKGMGLIDLELQTWTLTNSGYALADHILEHACGRISFVPDRG